jgi:uncharacterized protein YabE (DUF348 family)
MKKLVFAAAFLLITTISASAQTKKIAARSHGGSTIDLRSSDNFGLPSCTAAEKEAKAKAAREAKAKADGEKKATITTADSLLKVPNACIKPKTTSNPAVKTNSKKPKSKTQSSPK